MIIIKKHKDADTRTCDPSTVSKERLLDASIDHIQDVQKTIKFLADKMVESSKNHDKDKITDIDGFHDCFRNGFKDLSWLNRHYKLNRHHLQDPSGVPKDVNLIDVIEMIVDNVTAGMARGGECRDMTIPPKIIKDAINNTVKLLVKEIKVVDM